MILGSTFGIFITWMQGSPETEGFAKALLTVTLWMSIFLFQMPFRLKNIETTEKGILIKNLGNSTLVEYKDLQWVAMFDFTSPWFITIKYFDKDKGENKKISFMPNHADQKPFADDAMTEFIKGKIESDNPNFSNSEQPSKIKNFLQLFVLGLPVTILALYFINEAFNFI